VYNCIIWYARGIGVVKKMYYDMKGNLISTEELQSIKKNADAPASGATASVSGWVWVRIIGSVLMLSLSIFFLI